MKNKKYYIIIITLFVAISQIATGFSSKVFAEEDDMVLVAKAKSKLTTRITLEHQTQLEAENEVNDMFTLLYFRIIMKLPKNFTLMFGTDPQFNYQQTDPNENQVTLSTPPFLNVSYSTGLKAGPFSWSNVYFRVSSTTPGLYKNNSVYTFFTGGTTLAFVPAKFMEIYLNSSLTKYVNKYSNGPYGPNTNIKFSNSLTVQFNIIGGLKYCQSLSLSMGLVFSNKFNYAETWVGSHSTNLSLNYSVIPQFSVALYFASSGNNYTSDGDSNFSLYHRNSGMLGVSVGTTF